jgi:type I restriction enzyme S subunit
MRKYDGTYPPTRPCLASLDALITAQAKKLATLKLHKQGLMQSLFPSPDDKEPRTP